MKKVYFAIIFYKVTLGYLRVTDFGIARTWRPDNSQDTSGTPGYMGILLLLIITIFIAPEVMCR